jgi:hypothetical protein
MRLDVMRATIRVAVFGLFLTGAFAPQAQAYPFLQLDLLGGVYDSDPEEQTIVAPFGEFELFAILTPQDGKPFTFEDYYISVALIPSFPEPVSPAPDLGKFKFNGTTTVNVTADMTYGVPPIEQIVSTQGWDSGDLGKHGIYPTYFAEFKFSFNPLQTTAKYNTQDDPGGPSPGTGAYYISFKGDSSLLAAPYSLHFDLYSTKLRNCKTSGCDVDRDQFAPFSHDAELRRVPEPGSLTLLGGGLGLLAAATARRRRTRLS